MPRPSLLTRTNSKSDPVEQVATAHALEAIDALILVDDMSSMLTTAASTLATSATG